MVESTVKVMIRVTEDHHSYNIQSSAILDIPGHSKMDFRQVFSPFVPLQQVAASVTDNAIQNLLQGQQIILPLIGKTCDTTLLLGDLQEKGLVLTALDQIFQKANQLIRKEDIQIQISAIEFYGQTIADLGRLCKQTESQGSQNLKLVYQREGISIQDIHKERIFNVSQGARHLDGALFYKSQRSQILLSVLVTRTDRQSAKIKTGQFSVVFIPFQMENPAIQTDILGLKNMLLSFQKKESFQYIKTNFLVVFEEFLKKSGGVVVLFQVNPYDDFDLNIKILKFAQSCFYLSLTQSSSKQKISPYQAERIRKLREIINQLTQHIIHIQSHHQKKLKQLQKLIGIGPIQDLVQERPPLDLLQITEKFRTSIQTVKGLLGRNTELQDKLYRLETIKTENSYICLQNQSNHKKQIQKLLKDIQRVKSEILNIKQENKQFITDQNSGLSSELQALLLESHKAVEQQAAEIYNLPFTLKCRAADTRIQTQAVFLGANQTKSHLQTQYKLTQIKFSGQIQKITQAYQQVLKEKQNEKTRYSFQVAEFLRKQTEQFEGLKQEVSKLYTVFKQQQQLILSIEKGKFHNGIKPIYLTVHDIPRPITREKFPFFFQTLKTSKILTSRNDNNYIKVFSRLPSQKYQTRNKSAVRPVSQPASFTQSIPRPKLPLHSTQAPEIPLQQGEFLTTFQLQEAISSLQQKILQSQKEIRFKIKKNSSLKKEIQVKEKKLDKIIQEKVRNRNGYSLQVKHKMDSQIVLDSQKRILDKFIFITENIQSRPSTSKRPGTSSTYRVSSSFARRSMEKFVSPVRNKSRL